MSKSKSGAAPTPPTLNEIEADIQRQCTALGIDLSSTKPNVERTYDAILSLVGKNKRPARNNEIAQAVGNGDTDKSLIRLMQAGRIIRVAPGLYIPRVV